MYKSLLASHIHELVKQGKCSITNDPEWLMVLHRYESSLSNLNDLNVFNNSFFTVQHGGVNEDLLGTSCDSIIIGSRYIIIEDEYFVDSKQFSISWDRLETTLCIASSKNDFERKSNLLYSYVGPSLFWMCAQDPVNDWEEIIQYFYSKETCVMAPTASQSLVAKFPTYVFTRPSMCPRHNNVLLEELSRRYKTLIILGAESSEFSPIMNNLRNLPFQSVVLVGNLHCEKQMKEWITRLEGTLVLEETHAPITFWNTCGLVIDAWKKNGTLVAWKKYHDPDLDETTTMVKLKHCPPVGKIDKRKSCVVPNECSIGHHCMDDHNEPHAWVVHTLCKNTYCLSDIYEWMKNPKATCPLCRGPLKHSTLLVSYRKTNFDIYKTACTTDVFEVLSLIKNYQKTQQRAVGVIISDKTRGAFIKYMLHKEQLNDVYLMLPTNSKIWFGKDWNHLDVLINYSSKTDLVKSVCQFAREVPVVHCTRKN